jgi:DNA-binding NtrC family response regulator
MPGINGMEVAKEILEMNPKQKIIIASAYTEETFSPSLSQLGQLVELMRKPFHIDTLIDVIEKKQFYSKLQKLNKDTDIIQKFNLT